MDKEDLKYKFAKAKYRTGKVISSNSFALLGMISILATSIGGIAVTSSLDKQATDDSEVIVESFKQQQAFLSDSEQGVELQREYITEILKEEDISEKQAYDLLKEFREKTGVYPSKVVGMDIGNIGDLRECRAEVGNDNAKEIAACTVEKTKDDVAWDVANNVVLSVFWMIFVFGGAERARQWAKEKPKNPLYKH